MFGYIKPVSAELKVKEYELYKSIYCGLCASLGRNATCLSKFTLSYDFVFLALVRMALTGECGKIQKRRCMAHPTKKRAVVTNSAELDYCAKVSVLLTYGKIRDDIADERGTKRLTARLLSPVVNLMRKKALRAKNLSALDDIISKKLSALSKLEENKIYSPDAASDIFGELMAETASFGLCGKERRIAYEIGRHIGRFVYMTDAADDLSSDLEKHRYNPFIIPGKNNKEISDEFENRIPALRTSLIMELSGIESAVELIDRESNTEFLSILENIIYLGLPLQIDKVLKKTAEGEQN